MDRYCSVWADLLANGESCSRKLVSKPIRTAGIAAKMKRSFRVTTQRDLTALVAPNLLQKNFTAEEPNQRWVADLACLATEASRDFTSMTKKSELM